MEVRSIARGAVSVAQPMLGFHPESDRKAALEADAIVFEGARKIGVRRVELKAPQPADIVVDVEWSGVSSGTERLLWSGDMPPFPGMGYPLVPGYEAVGVVIEADIRSDMIGRRVFVPGARCYKDAHGLFGASSSRLVAPAERAVIVDIDNPKDAVLLALAATAHHAIAGGAPPDLIVGHGALGRLLARVSMALGAPPPNVWEIEPERADADGYAVMDPDFDARADYQAIYDVSGDASVLDSLVAHLRPRGEIVLAGFYAQRPSFAFPPAFMKEARFRIAAEWTSDDLTATLALIRSGALSLDGLVTHSYAPSRAEEAYRTAFEDPRCLKLVLDWRKTDGAAI
jgi:3-hydroxyethyl bacteriochlorophyllide a dehydrogenase